jgi:hypothetical protein
METRVQVELEAVDQEQALIQVRELMEPIILVVVEVQEMVIVLLILDLVVQV